MRRTIGLLVALTMVSLGCRERASVPAASPPAPAQASPAPADTGSSQDQEACVDQWLTARKLDPYGSPAGTMYAGGTPLFDERTGETRDRLEYVYSRHPEARAACAGNAR